MPGGLPAIAVELEIRRVHAGIAQRLHHARRTLWRKQRIGARQHSWHTAPARMNPVEFGGDVIGFRGTAKDQQRVGIEFGGP